MLTSIAVLLVFSYGHVFSFLRHYFSESFIGVGYLSGLTAVLFLTFRFMSKKENVTIKKFTMVFNIVAISLILMPVSLISYKQIQRTFRDSAALEEIKFRNEDFNVTNQPDIYYIIVERYGSEAVLK